MSYPMKIYYQLSYLYWKDRKTNIENYIPYKGTKEFYITPINTLKLEKPIYITMGGKIVNLVSL